MSGRTGTLNLGEALTREVSQTGSTPANEDGGSYGRSRFGGYGDRDRSGGDGGYRGYGNRRDDGYGRRDNYHREGGYERRDGYDRRDGDEERRPREIRPTVADTVDNWRKSGLDPVVPAEDLDKRRDDRDGGRFQGEGRSGDRDGGYRSSRYGDRDGERREGGYRSNRYGDRDGERREGGYRSNRYGDRDGDRDGERREGGYRSNRYGDRDGERREGGYRSDSRDGDNDRQGMKHYGVRATEGAAPIEKPVPVEVKPAHVSTNRFDALGEEEEEEDLAKMSLEELKKRAQGKRLKEEQKKQQELEERDRNLKEVKSKATYANPAMLPTKSQSEREAPKREAIDLEVAWGVDLPARYSNIFVATISENKTKQLLELVKNMIASKNIRDLKNYLLDATSDDITSMVYQMLMKLTTIRTTIEHQNDIVATLLQELNAKISSDIVDNVLEKVYLIVTTMDVDYDVVRKNMGELVVALADKGCIQHVPLFTRPEFQSDEEVVEEKKPKEEKKVEKVEKVDLEARYKPLLELNLLGESLTKKAMEMELEMTPEFVYYLLKTVVGDKDVTEFIKEKKNRVMIPFFKENAYGDIIINCFDNVDASVHVEILNQIVRFWVEKGMPAKFLEGCFWTMFDNALVYDEVLEGWKDQGLTDNGYKKAIIKLANVLYEIQDMIDARIDE